MVDVGFVVGVTPQMTPTGLSLIHIYVLLGTGCKVLGPITIGENSRVGANSVVLKCIPANATAIGIPARVVRINGSKVLHESEVLNQRDYPDVVHDALRDLSLRVAKLEYPGETPEGAPLPDDPVEEP